MSGCARRVRSNIGASRPSPLALQLEGSRCSGRRRRRAGLIACNRARLLGLAAVGPAHLSPSGPGRSGSFRAGEVPAQPRVGILTPIRGGSSPWHVWSLCSRWASRYRAHLEQRRKFSPRREYQGTRVAAALRPNVRALKRADRLGGAKYYHTGLDERPSSSWAHQPKARAPPRSLLIWLMHRDHGLLEWKEVASCAMEGFSWPATIPQDGLGSAGARRGGLHGALWRQAESSRLP